jgi:S1-C subfamily serine protease
MNRLKSFFRSSFGAALLGGFVVAVLAIGAVSAGWIGKNETTTQTVTSSVPVSNNTNNDPNLVNQIYNRDSDGVGFITAEGVTEDSGSPFGGTQSGTATGSGFLIDTDGDMVTNNHVVEGAKKITVSLGTSDATYNASVVGTDPSTDLALLKVDAPSSEMKPLQLGNSDDAKVGDPVIAIGNPFGLDRTVTTGIVSALQREIQSLTDYQISNVIQTDAAINPGNSGGPLINSDGQVIGVNSQIATGGSSGQGGNVGIGFAIPVNTVKDVVDQLKNGGSVEHAYLGISGATLSSTVADALNLPVNEGVLVQDVTKDGPSGKAGLKGSSEDVTIEGQKVGSGGDVITKANGDDISSMDDLIAKVNEAKVGDTLDLTVLRDGKTQDIKVTLGTRPDDISGSDSSSSGNGSGGGSGGGSQNQSPPQQELPPGFGQ